METRINDRAIIISGGPGAGKTSMIEQLEHIGYCCIAESGRDIIQGELKVGGTRLPWVDPEGFAWEMFTRAVADYNQVLDKGIYTFFDRGLPDVLGYLSLCGLPIDDEMWLAAKK